MRPRDVLRRQTSADSEAVLRIERQCNHAEGHDDAVSRSHLDISMCEADLVELIQPRQHVAQHGEDGWKVRHNAQRPLIETLATLHDDAGREHPA
jgi:hypothetical protein